jgi:hypothetical protein
MCYTDHGRYFAVLLMFLANAPVAAALNLVPNPSFETFTACPAGLSELAKATPWEAPTVGSPDYYNACASSASLVSVPGNNFGSQLARTGAAYGGAIFRPTNNYREYLETPLTQSLTAGQTVHVEFWVSLSDGSHDAIDRIGAYLSIGSVGPLSTAPTLPYAPQVESPAGIFLNDKTNWMKIAGSYTAIGGEDHIVIGNFHDNSTTNSQPLTGWYPGSYYYVDDVSVESVGPPPLQSTSTYAAKFVCGVQPDVDVKHVVDAQGGRYATKINVHNNTGIPINFRKKVIRLRGGEVAIPPAPTKPLETLKEDEAMEVVCRDIYTLNGISITTGQIPPYIEGFLILEVYDQPGAPKGPPDPLDVEGIYTYKGDLPTPPGFTGSGVSIKVVVYPAKSNTHLLH